MNEPSSRDPMGATVTRERRPHSRVYVQVCSLVNSPEKWLYRSGIRSTAALTLPDFMCIGAQKAGTTWLAENLRRHPEVFIPTPQSTHYFDMHFHRSLRFYSSRFEAGSAKVKGESCPAYGVMSQKRIRAVRSLMPDVRILFMIRNPIDRAWSHALMGLVQRRGRRFEDVTESQFHAHFTGQRARLRSNYISILDNWLEVFPPGQIHVGFFEDIVARPRELLKDVFRHLRISETVDYDSFPYRQVINQGVGIRMPDVYRTALAQIYGEEIERLHQRFGDRVAAWRV